MIAGTLAVCAWSLGCAFILRFAERLIAKRPGRTLYVVALCTSLYVNLLVYVGACAVIGGVAALTGSDSATLTAALAMIPTGYLLQAKALANRFGVSFDKACLIALAVFAPTAPAGVLVLAGVARWHRVSADAWKHRASSSAMFGSRQ